MHPPLNRRCFVNLPYSWLRRGFLERFCQEGLQPEIGLDGDVLGKTARRDFQAAADRLAAAGLACTQHAPFTDLFPGSSSAPQRAHARQRLCQALELVPIFGPRAVICHLGTRGLHPGLPATDWLGYSLELWQEMLAATEPSGVPIMLENTYEPDGRYHRAVFEAIASPRLGFCLDVGHALAMANRPPAAWLAELAPWLGHLHLHDNHGSRDEHLAIGRGLIDFPDLFRRLAGWPRPLGLTLEPHTEPDLWQSLTTLAAMPEFAALLATPEPSTPTSSPTRP
ncbi:MAG: sugar phosphate isomerase/epimerase family protein [Thermodesulfobacteriota bacterium]